jgi:hypothetical protein
MEIQKIDPILLQDLEDPGADGLVQALISVMDPEALPLPSAEEVKLIAQRLVAAATDRTHLKPERIKIFGSMGTIAVKAQPDFLRDLIKQDDVLSAVASHGTKMFRGGSGV